MILMGWNYLFIIISRYNVNLYFNFPSKSHLIEYNMIVGMKVVIMQKNYIEYACIMFVNVILLVRYWFIICVLLMYLCCSFVG